MLGRKIAVAFQPAWRRRELTPFPPPMCFGTDGPNVQGYPHVRQLPWQCCGLHWERDKLERDDPMVEPRMRVVAAMTCMNGLKITLTPRSVVQLHPALTKCTIFRRFYGCDVAAEHM